MKIVVIGAGASGLAFALESINQGLKVRILDKRSARSSIGKATGVSLGTWMQLEKFGISSKSCSDAIPMNRFAFHDDECLIANITVPKIHDEPPAYLYPQNSLERKMEKELNNRGVFVEYGIELKELISLEESVRVTLFNEKNRLLESMVVDWVIGADGAHSSVREITQVPFVGKDYPEKWSVAEIKTNMWNTDVQAQLFLQSNREGLFLSQPSKGVVQGIINSTNIQDRLMSKFSDAILIYKREFNVSLRRVSTPRIGKIWLIGDAAHVQSPVGGQGLNLAIWDGITLAEQLSKLNLSVEKQLVNRAKRVLFFTNFDYMMLVSDSVFIRFLRNRFWILAERYPIISKWFFKLISGVW